MFERYTEKARQVIFSGRHEAESVFSTLLIEPEHLLISLLKGDKELAQLIGMEEDQIRKEVLAITPPGKKIDPSDPATAAGPSLTDVSMRALSYGFEEAERYNHEQVGTAHILLGLVREEESLAAKILRRYGINLTSASVIVEGLNLPQKDLRARPEVPDQRRQGPRSEGPQQS